MRDRRTLVMLALLVLPLALMGIIAAALLVEAVSLVRRLAGKNRNPAAHG